MFRHRSGVFIVNFERSSHHTYQEAHYIVLLTLVIFDTCFLCFRYLLWTKMPTGKHTGVILPNCWFWASCQHWLYFFVLILCKFGIFYHPLRKCLFKANNRITRKKSEICSELTIKSPERRLWRRSGVFIVNFEHLSNLFLMFLLLTLNK